MKYVLVDKGDNIIDKVELNSELREAKKFFIKRKQIDEKEFDNMWKVMSEKEYNSQLTASLQNKQYEWWKDDEDWLDIDK
jgi:hypothetical protein|tara:strand:- start:340 stop:579 length:240 start_codon:yes stop_codon:yes gene_type:complete